MATKTQFYGVGAEIKRLLKEVKDLEQEGVRQLKLAAITVIEALQSKTPVWSGETVRNYAVGVGQKPSGGEKAPIGTSPPGDTNSMSLGEEPRRPANEAAAIADAHASLSRLRRLQSLVITNLVSDEKWDLVDSGSAPTPERARYPGGVAIAGLQKAKQMLGENWR